MLKIGLGNTEFVPINCGAETINEYIQCDEMDLVLAHFLLAYTPIDTVIKQVNHVLKPAGLFSLVSSTVNSFPELQRLAKQLAKSWNPFSQLLSAKIKRDIQSSLHETSEQIKKRLNEANLKIISEIETAINVKFKSTKDLIEYFSVSGWVVHTNQRINITTWLTLLCFKLALINMKFPIEDEQRVHIFLCQKKM